MGTELTKIIDEAKIKLKELSDFRNTVSELNLKNESLSALDLKIKEYKNLTSIAENDSLLKALNTLSPEVVETITNIESLKKRLTDGCVTKEEYVKLFEAALEKIKDNKDDLENDLNAVINDYSQAKSADESLNHVREPLLDNTFIHRNRAIKKRAELIGGLSKTQFIANLLDKHKLNYTVEKESVSDKICEPYSKFTIKKFYTNKSTGEKDCRSITILVSDAKDEGFILFDNLPVTTCHIKDVKENGGIIIKPDEPEKIEDAITGIIFVREIAIEFAEKTIHELNKQLAIAKLLSDFDNMAQIDNPQGIIEYLVQYSCYNTNVDFFKDILNRYGDAIDLKKQVSLICYAEDGSVIPAINPSQPTSFASIDDIGVKESVYNNSIYLTDILSINLDKKNLTKITTPLGLVPFYILPHVRKRNGKDIYLKEICKLALDKLGKSNISNKTKCDLFNCYLGSDIKSGDCSLLKFMRSLSLGFNENIKELQTNLTYSQIYFSQRKREDLIDTNLTPLYRFLACNCANEMKSCIGQSISGDFQEVIKRHFYKIINPRTFFSREQKAQENILIRNIEHFMEVTDNNYIKDRGRKNA